LQGGERTIMEGEMKKTLIIIGCILILSFIVIFIWPTKYRYTKATISNNTFPVRMNRLTGKTEYFGISSGWSAPESTEWEIEGSPREIPLFDLKKISGKAELKDLSGWTICLEIYNGSEWKLQYLTVVIRKNDTNKNNIWERRYKGFANIKSLSAGTVYIEVADLERNDEWDWEIVSAIGIR